MLAGDATFLFLMTGAGAQGVNGQTAASQGVAAPGDNAFAAMFAAFTAAKPGAGKGPTPDLNGLPYTPGTGPELSGLPWVPDPASDPGCAPEQGGVTPPHISCGPDSGAPALRLDVGVVRRAHSHLPVGGPPPEIHAETPVAAGPVLAVLTTAPVVENAPGQPVTPAASMAASPVNPAGPQAMSLAAAPAANHAASPANLAGAQTAPQTAAPAAPDASPATGRAAPPAGAVPAPPLATAASAPAMDATEPSARPHPAATQPHQAQPQPAPARLAEALMQAAPPAAEAAEPLRRLLVAGRAPLEAWSGAKTETPGAASTPVSGAVKAAAAPLAPTPNPAATPPQGAAAPALAEPQPAAALRQPLPVTNAAPHAAGDHKPDPVIERAQETARLEFARAMERPASPAAANGARLPQGAPAALAAQIASRFHAGARNFEIRLDPPQLGRVDVRMKLGADNRVQAIMTVERADALGELQRAARELERDLADAGLHLEAGGLTFQLSDQGENPDRDGGDEGAGDFTALAADADAGTDAGPQPRAYGFMLSGAGGVDMRV